MLGTLFGIEIVMIKRTERTRDNTYINSSFLNVNHAWNDLKLYKLWASFRTKLFFIIVVVINSW